MVGDVGGSPGAAGGWAWSEERLALERLCRVGEAVCTTRRSWRRVYDLPERALPAELIRREPEDAECLSTLIGLAGRAMGVATRRDLADYFRLRPAEVDAGLPSSGLAQVEVEGWANEAWAHPDLLGPREPESSRTTLLSPFDSLIWDRRRTWRLFQFAVLLEAYLPRSQRVNGYFSMPLLSGGRLVGRVDPARQGTLIALSASLSSPEALPELAIALREAAAWVGCDRVHVERLEPAGLARTLARELNR